MNGDYADDRKFADQWDKQVQLIIRELLVVPATIEHDRKFATDLMIYRIKHGPRAGQPVADVAARIRRPGNFWARTFPSGIHWGEQFTVRSRRDSGADTELKKFIDGFCDWMFYGHVEQRLLRHWIVLALDVFRLFYKTASYEEQDNKDGTYFRAFRITSFPPAIIVGASDTMRAAIDNGVDAVSQLDDSEQQKWRQHLAEIAEASAIYNRRIAEGQNQFEAACNLPVPTMNRPAGRPDLQELIVKHGGYHLITPEAWADWDRANADYQAGRRSALLADRFGRNPKSTGGQ